MGKKCRRNITIKEKTMTEKEIKRARIIILIFSCFFILFGFGVAYASAFEIIKDFTIRVVAFIYGVVIALGGIYCLYVYFTTKEDKATITNDIEKEI